MSRLVGRVILWAGDLTEENERRLQLRGWLPCDGRTLDKEEYEELYEAIGDKYGVAEDDLASGFVLPNLNRSGKVDGPVAEGLHYLVLFTCSPTVDDFGKALFR
ncbi:phage tail protein [Ferrimonas marina]|uniref:Phage Tail Collar Domain n=1 Tax=Ferrimonas marina TaxID=299255 RepID=A0A1M5NIQ3_9GAMM|nr:phage tail protein [Ferrimonas marina]SHG89398.1 Phage Tail Collar Domain [Ferrimonas marina]